MDSRIRDGFLDSRWILGFAMDFGTRDGFLDSRQISGFTMDSWTLDVFWVHEANLNSR